MSRHDPIGAGRGRKRAVVAVQIAVSLVVILGFAALTVDIGAIYNAKADLQRTADAAALAAAGRLGEYSTGSPVELATAAALQYTQSNDVLGQQVTLGVDTDVVFGRATYDAVQNQYTFTPDQPLPDAVQVTVRKTANSPNDSLTLYFARVFGITNTQLFARATAVMVPRDIAVVADLSGSHSDDSELRHYQVTQINLHEVWDALPGGIDDVGTGWDFDDLPAGWVEGDGSVPQAAGPAWGYMRDLGYGTMNLDSSYSPAADPGLIQLTYNQDWSNAELESALSARGYIPSEIGAIMDNQYDANGVYQYRVAVALGLADWYSGQPGGYWEQAGVDVSETGNGNTWISSNELNWTETFLGRSLNESSSIWLDYINNYMRASYTTMVQANSEFLHRFGIKTFVNYLLERRYSHAMTPELADVPTQPMQAVKDAVQFLTDMISDLETDDRMSLEVYAAEGDHEVDLTHIHLLVSDRLNEMQAGHYASYTNMGGGMERAIEELTGVRGRPMAHKMMILLTDGNANVNAAGTPGDYAGAAAYALDQAQVAADNGIRIFAVSVGAESNLSLMQQIASLADGEHFHAEGSIEEYSTQLTQIFQGLGNKRPVQLIE